MSAHVEDDELKELIRNGAKIVARKPGAAAAPAQPSEAAQIISAIRSLDSTLVALSHRPAPDVKIAPAEVSVKPQIHVEAPKPTPRKWRVEVTERDKTADQRIKSLTIEAID